MGISKTLQIRSSWGIFGAYIDVVPVGGDMGYFFNNRVAMLTTKMVEKAYEYLCG